MSKQTAFVKATEVAGLYTPKEAAELALAASEKMWAELNGRVEISYLPGFGPRQDEARPARKRRKPSKRARAQIRARRAALQSHSELDVEFAAVTG